MKTISASANSNKGFNSMHFKNCSNRRGKISKKCKNQRLTQKLIEAHFNEYNLKSLLNEIWTVKRNIYSKKFSERNDDFTQEIALRLFYLHDYCLGIKKITNKYPWISEWSSLLKHYVLVENEVCRNNSYRNIETAQQRILRILHTIFKDVFCTNEMSMNITIFKSILTFLVSVTENEYNDIKLVDKIFEVLVTRIGCLDELEKLIGDDKLTDYEDVKKRLEDPEVHKSSSTKQEDDGSVVEVFKVSSFKNHRSTPCTKSKPVIGGNPPRVSKTSLPASSIHTTTTSTTSTTSRTASPSASAGTAPILTNNSKNSIPADKFEKFQKDFQSKNTEEAGIKSDYLDCEMVFGDSNHSSPAAATTTTMITGMTSTTIVVEEDDDNQKNKQNLNKAVSCEEVIVLSDSDEDDVKDGRVDEITLISSPKKEQIEEQDELEPPEANFPILIGEETLLANDDNDTIVTEDTTSSPPQQEQGNEEAEEENEEQTFQFPIITNVHTLNTLEENEQQQQQQQDEDEDEDHQHKAEVEEINFQTCSVITEEVANESVVSFHENEKVLIEPNKNVNVDERQDDYEQEEKEEEGQVPDFVKDSNESINEKSFLADSNDSALVVENESGFLEPTKHDSEQIQVNDNEEEEEEEEDEKEKEVVKEEILNVNENHCEEEKEEVQEDSLNTNTNNCETDILDKIQEFVKESDQDSKEEIINVLNENLQEKKAIILSDILISKPQVDSQEIIKAADEGLVDQQEEVKENVLDENEVNVDNETLTDDQFDIKKTDDESKDGNNKFEVAPDFEENQKLVDKQQEVEVIPFLKEQEREVVGNVQEFERNVYTDPTTVQATTEIETEQVSENNQIEIEKVAECIDDSTIVQETTEIKTEQVPENNQIEIEKVADCIGDATILPETTEIETDRVPENNEIEEVAECIGDSKIPQETSEIEKKQVSENDEIKKVADFICDSTITQETTEIEMERVPEKEKVSECIGDSTIPQETTEFEKEQVPETNEIEKVVKCIADSMIPQKTSEIEKEEVSENNEIEQVLDSIGDSMITQEISKIIENEQVSENNEIEKVSECIELEFERQDEKSDGKNTENELIEDDQEALEKIESSSQNIYSEEEKEEEQISKSLGKVENEANSVLMESEHKNKDHDLTVTKEMEASEAVLQNVNDVDEKEKKDEIKKISGGKVIVNESSFTEASLIQVPLLKVLCERITVQYAISVEQPEVNLNYNGKMELGEQCSSNNEDPMKNNLVLLANTATEIYKKNESITKSKNKRRRRTSTTPVAGQRRILHRAAKTRSLSALITASMRIPIEETQSPPLNAPPSPSSSPTPPSTLPLASSSSTPPSPLPPASSPPIPSAIESDCKPHDFKTSHKSGLSLSPFTTENVFQEKPFTSANELSTRIVNPLTSEDSDDSEDNLFIDEENSNKAEESDDYDKETIVDEFEFINTEDISVCISIPEGGSEQDIKVEGIDINRVEIIEQSQSESQVEVQDQPQQHPSRNTTDHSISNILGSKRTFASLASRKAYDDDVIPAKMRKPVKPTEKTKRLEGAIKKISTAKSKTKLQNEQEEDSEISVDKSEMITSQDSLIKSPKCSVDSDETGSRQASRSRSTQLSRSRPKEKSKQKDAKTSKEKDSGEKQVEEVELEMDREKEPQAKIENEREVKRAKPTKGISEDQPRFTITNFDPEPQRHKQGLDLHKTVDTLRKKVEPVEDFDRFLQESKEPTKAEVEKSQNSLPPPPTPPLSISGKNKIAPPTKTSVASSGYNYNDFSRFESVLPKNMTKTPEQNENVKDEETEKGEASDKNVKTGDKSSKDRKRKRAVDDERVTEGSKSKREQVTDEKNEARRSPSKETPIKSNKEKKSEKRERSSSSSSSSSSSRHVHKRSSKKDNIEKQGKKEQEVKVNKEKRGSEKQRSSSVSSNSSSSNSSFATSHSRNKETSKTQSRHNTSRASMREQVLKSNLYKDVDERSRSSSSEESIKEQNLKNKLKKEKEQAKDKDKTRGNDRNKNESSTDHQSSDDSIADKEKKSKSKSRSDSSKKKNDKKQYSSRRPESESKSKRHVRSPSKSPTPEKRSDRSKHSERKLDDVQEKRLKREHQDSAKSTSKKQRKDSNEEKKKPTESEKNIKEKDLKDPVVTPEKQEQHQECSKKDSDKLKPNDNTEQNKGPDENEDLAKKKESKKERDRSKNESTNTTYKEIKKASIDLDFQETPSKNQEQKKQFDHVKSTYDEDEIVKDKDVKERTENESIPFLIASKKNLDNQDKVNTEINEKTQSTSEVAAPSSDTKKKDFEKSNTSLETINVHEPNFETMTPPKKRKSITFDVADVPTNDNKNLLFPNSEEITALATTAVSNIPETLRPENDSTIDLNKMHFLPASKLNDKHLPPEEEVIVEQDQQLALENVIEEVVIESSEREFEPLPIKPAPVPIPDLIATPLPPSELPEPPMNVSAKSTIEGEEHQKEGDAETTALSMVAMLHNTSEPEIIEGTTLISTTMSDFREFDTMRSISTCVSNTTTTSTSDDILVFSGNGPQLISTTYSYMTTSSNRDDDNGTPPGGPLIGSTREQETNHDLTAVSSLTKAHGSGGDVSVAGPLLIDSTNTTEITEDELQWDDETSYLFELGMMDANVKVKTEEFDESLQRDVETGTNAVQYSLMSSMQTDGSLQTAVHYLMNDKDILNLDKQIENETDRQLSPVDIEFSKYLDATHAQGDLNNLPGKNFHLAQLMVGEEEAQNGLTHHLTDESESVTSSSFEAVQCSPHPNENDKSTVNDPLGIKYAFSGVLAFGKNETSKSPPQTQTESTLTSDQNNEPDQNTTIATNFSNVLSKDLNKANPDEILPENNKSALSPPKHDPKPKVVAESLTPYSVGDYTAIAKENKNNEDSNKRVSGNDCTKHEPKILNFSNTLPKSTSIKRSSPLQSESNKKPQPNVDMEYYLKRKRSVPIRVKKDPIPQSMASSSNNSRIRVKTNLVGPESDKNEKPNDPDELNIRFENLKYSRNNELFNVGKEYANVSNSLSKDRRPAGAGAGEPLSKIKQPTINYGSKSHEEELLSMDPPAPTKKLRPERPQETPVAGFSQNKRPLPSASHSSRPLPLPNKNKQQLHQARPDAKRQLIPPRKTETSSRIPEFTGNRSRQERTCTLPPTRSAPPSSRSYHHHSRSRPEYDGDTSSMPGHSGQPLFNPAWNADTKWSYNLDDLFAPNSSNKRFMPKW